VARFSPDLAHPDRRLSRPVRRRRRRVLRRLDRAGAKRRHSDPCRAPHRAFQHGGLARPAGHRSAQPAAERPCISGVVDERVVDQPWAIAPDRDRGDGDRAVRLAESVDDDRLGAHQRRHGPGGSVVRHQRPRRDCAATMAEPAVAVPARRRRRLLARRAGAPGGDGVAAHRRVAVGAQDFFVCGGPIVRCSRWQASCSPSSSSKVLPR